MGEIYNCRITEVKTKIEKDFSITVKLEFVVRTKKRSFCFSEKFYDVRKDAGFKAIMFYCNAQKIKELQYKVIRGVMTEDENLIGIGDAITDNFILFTDPSKPYTEAELNK